MEAAAFLARISHDVASLATRSEQYVLADGIAGCFSISTPQFPLFWTSTIVFFVTLYLSYSTNATVTSDTIVTMRM